MWDPSNVVDVGEIQNIVLIACPADPFDEFCWKLPTLPPDIIPGPRNPQYAGLVRPTVNEILGSIAPEDVDSLIIMLLFDNIRTTGRRLSELQIERLRRWVHVMGDRGLGNAGARSSRGGSETTSGRGTPNVGEDAGALEGEDPAVVPHAEDRVANLHAEQQADQQLRDLRRQIVEEWLQEAMGDGAIMEVLEGSSTSAGTRESWSSPGRARERAAVEQGTLVLTIPPPAAPRAAFARRNRMRG